MNCRVIIACLLGFKLASANCPYGYPPPPPCKDQNILAQDTGIYDALQSLPAGYLLPLNLQNGLGSLQSLLPPGALGQLRQLQPGYGSLSSLYAQPPLQPVYVQPPLQHPVYAQHPLPPPGLPQNPPSQCVTHQVERTVRPVVDECVSQVPFLRKRLRVSNEQYTRHVPVVEKCFSQQEEKFIRHIPVIQKICKPIIETRTRHVPVIKKRLRTVVEPYTSHVPILEKYTRPVEETVVRSVPVVERRCRPVFHSHLRHIPVTENRVRPFLESTVCQIPVKQRYLKNLVEQRIRTVQGCGGCHPEQNQQLPHHLPPQPLPQPNYAFLSPLPPCGTSLHPCQCQ